MNPLKLIADYLDNAKSHLYGIFAFWVIIFNLPIVFTAIFVDQELVYKKTGMLKNEYIRYTYFNIHNWKNWVIELGGLLLAAGLTYLMIWVLPKTLVAHAYDRELQDQYDREFKKLTKEEELEKKKQSVADKQLTTANKIENVVKKQENVEQLEKGQWAEDFQRFSKSGLAAILPSIANVIYAFKGHIGKFWDQDMSVTRNANVNENDIAIAHSNGLIELNTSDNTISLTEKGKYFLSQNYFERLP